MSFITTNPLIKLIARIIVGAVFVSFAADKISDPSSFANSISNYGILPEIFINISALILPWLELVVGIMLIFGFKVKAASLISTSLLIIFTLAIVSALARGLDISCGCSSNSPKVGWPKILENSGLILLSGVSFFNNSLRFSFDSQYSK